MVFGYENGFTLVDGRIASSAAWMLEANLADDARLTLKYQGTWQPRPESMKYAAVSAVGFNASKTKAIVSVRLRSMRGMVDIHFMEMREGKWVKVPLARCRWIVIA
jgi:hypothetical protein